MFPVKNLINISASTTESSTSGVTCSSQLPMEFWRDTGIRMGIFEHRRASIVWITSMMKWSTWPTMLCRRRAKILAITKIKIRYIFILIYSCHSKLFGSICGRLVSVPLSLMKLMSKWNSLLIIWLLQWVPRSSANSLLFRYFGIHLAVWPWLHAG